MRENHSLYLGPAEQRGIALRQFDALLESAREGVTLSASLVREYAPDRLWNPSERFTQRHFKAHVAPDANNPEELAARDCEMAERQPQLTQKAEPPRAEVQQTLVAFDARRNSLKASGEYDFALGPTVITGWSRS